MFIVSVSSRRHVTKVVLALVAAGGAYLVFGRSEQREIEDVVRGFAKHTRFAPTLPEQERVSRVTSAVAMYAIESVVVSAPEIGEARGAEALSALAQQTRGMGFESSIRESDVRIDSERRARANLLVEFRFRTFGEERRELRPVLAELERRKGAWRLTLIDVGGSPKDEPEARP